MLNVISTQWTNNESISSLTTTWNKNTNDSNNNNNNLKWKDKWQQQLCLKRHTVSLLMCQKLMIKKLANDLQKFTLKLATLVAKNASQCWMINASKVAVNATLGSRQYARFNSIYWPRVIFQKQIIINCCL